MGRRGKRAGRYKTKNKTRDVDQIYDDMQEGNRKRRIVEATVPDEDKPGLGQHFCLTCSRYFVDERTLERHTQSKPHKRRLKTLEEPPHTQLDANRAAGLMPAEPPPKRPRNIFSS